MKDGTEGEAGKVSVTTDSSATNGGDNCENAMRSLPEKTRNKVTGAALVAIGAEVAAAAAAAAAAGDNSLPLGGTFTAALLAKRDANNSVVDGLSDDGPNKTCSKNKNDNNRDKIFVCPICNRCFGYKHVLQNHERTHTGEKPFECPECHKRFTRDHHLKTHMRLHTGEKPYQCSHCDRQFVQVANLRRHLRVHTGERPYACQMCTSRFSDSNQLKAHMLIHRGEKPFQCQECKGRFRRRHHLIHHKCPKDEANLGKPRRGRRPKAYDQLPTVTDDRPRNSDNEDAVLDNNNSSSEQEHPPNAQAISHVGVHKNRRKPSHTIRILTPQQRELFLRDKVTMQTQAIDMSLSPSSEGPLTVLVPRSSRFLPSSVEGVLDLSSSRSDSEVEPIEEEVNDGLEDDGLDDDDFDDDSCSDHDMRQLPRSRLKHMNTMEPINGGDGNHDGDDDSDGVHIHGNGEHVSSEEEEEGSNGALPLTKTKS